MTNKGRPFGKLGSKQSGLDVARNRPIQRYDDKKQRNSSHRQ
jgi:hypothetical protein